MQIFELKNEMRCGFNYIEFLEKKYNDSLKMEFPLIDQYANSNKNRLEQQIVKKANFLLDLLYESDISEFEDEYKKLVLLIVKYSTNVEEKANVLNKYFMLAGFSIDPCFQYIETILSDISYFGYKSFCLEQMMESIKYLDKHVKDEEKRIKLMFYSSMIIQNRLFVNLDKDLNILAYVFNNSRKYIDYSVLTLEGKQLVDNTIQFIKE